MHKINNNNNTKLLSYLSFLKSLFFFLNFLPCYFFLHIYSIKIFLGHDTVRVVILKLTVFC